MKNFDQIERYLSGEMNDTEKQAFEAAMAKDAALAEEVELQAFEEDAIDLMLEEQLLQQVREIRTEQPVVQIKKKKPVLMIRWVQVAVAASVILIAGFFIGRSINQDSSPAELAANYYKEYTPNFSPPRQINDEDPQERETYLNILNNKDVRQIDEAIAYYNEQPGFNALYKLSHAYLIKKDYNQAIQSFEQYLNEAAATERDFSRAQFYLALAYLANDNQEQAKELLLKIKSTDNHIFKLQAEELLKKIEDR